MTNQTTKLISAAQSDAVATSAEGDKDAQSWGELTWKITSESMPGTEMTYGTCRIEPGERNPLHSHPNCEEILYVVSGRCEHRLGEELIELREGDAIRIPRNVRHYAKNIGDGPMFALIFFSSGERQAINHEGEGAA